MADAFSRTFVFKLLDSADISDFSFDRKNSYFDIDRQLQLYETWLTTLS